MVTCRFYPERGHRSLVYWFHLLKPGDRKAICVHLASFRELSKYSFFPDFTVEMIDLLIEELRKAWVLSPLHIYPPIPDLMAFVARHKRVLSRFKFR